MKQTEKILDYCKKHGSITNREAFMHLNINSPTKRISKIRESGMFDVQDVRETRVNSLGESVYFKRYYIKPYEGAEA